MANGVATRRYERILDPQPTGISSRSKSKSAVRRRFVESTRGQLEASPT